VEGCVFNLFKAVVKNCFSVFFMVIRGRVFERHTLYSFLIQISSLRMEGNKEMRSGWLLKKLKWLSKCSAHSLLGPSLPVSPAKCMKFHMASSQAGWVRFSSHLYFCLKRSISRMRGGLDSSWMGLIFLRVC